LVTVDGCNIWNILRAFRSERTPLAEDSFIIKTSVWSLKLSAWDLLS